MWINKYSRVTWGKYFRTFQHWSTDNLVPRRTAYTCPASTQLLAPQVPEQNQNITGIRVKAIPIPHWVSPSGVCVWQWAAAFLVKKTLSAGPPNLALPLVAEPYFPSIPALYCLVTIKAKNIYESHPVRTDPVTELTDAFGGSLGQRLAGWDLEDGK